MPDLALIEGGQCTTAGATLALSTGTSVGGPLSANTKGNWVQLIAATAHAASWVIVTIKLTASQKVLVDIGVGASGSEQVLIPNLYLDAPSVAGGVGSAHNQILLPLEVAAGARIAARIASSIANATATISVTLVAPTLQSGVGCGRVLDYGTAAASSGGTSIDPGATANTKGAWTQLAASTTHPISWLMLILNHVNTTIATALDWLIDIGVGASGSEQVIWANQHVRGGNTYSRPSPDVICFPASIPAGSRLAVRAQSTSTVAADRVFDCIVYGVS